MRKTIDGQRFYSVTDLEARFPKRVADRIWSECAVGTLTEEFITTSGRLTYDGSDMPMPWCGLCDEVSFLYLCSKCSKAIAEEAQRH